MTLIKHTQWEKRQKENFQGRYSKFQDAVDQGTGKGYDFNDFSQDIFSSLYQVSPDFPEDATSGAAWAKKALDELKSLPEFNQIRESGTKTDAFQSGLGSTILTKHFADSLPEMKEENPDDIQRKIKNMDYLLEDAPEGHPKTAEFQAEKEGLEEALGASQQAWEAAAEGLDPGKLRQVMRRAIAEAQTEIDEAEENANAFGFGTEPGQDGYTSAEAKLAIAQKIQSNPKLQQIAELAGRFRRDARKQQANKKKPGPDELTDIECGNDLGRVIPAELALMNDPDSETLFFKKYLERGLIQYKLTEVPFEKRGPIVICIDNSGSMAGVPEIWSKAIALAMAQIAVDQKRAIQIIHFNAGVAKSDYFPAGKVGPEALVESCAFFAGGGTRFEPVLNKAFETIEKGAEAGLKKADVVFITDDCCEINADALESLREAKDRAEANVYTISLGSSKANTMKKISDSVDHITDFADDSDVKERIFSV